MLLLASCMLAVPWIVAQSRLSGRERLVAAAYWMIGAIAFGYAVRLFVLWWVLSIVCVRLGAGVGHPRRRPRRRRGFHPALGLSACL